MERSFWMQMGENWENLSARCHHKTLHESQKFHTWRWAVPALLGQPSGSVHLLWVLWAPDVCSWSFSFLAKPCSLAVGSVIMLTTQTQAKSKQLSFHLSPVVVISTSSTHNCVLEGTISKIMFFANFSSCHQEMVSERVGLEGEVLPEDKH